ncbi:putative stress-responsive transcriptional regulator [Streptococcus pneumoniae]|nr:putative stress-responsive transcriptional regulator [Streptococcus pneumoniae]VSG41130.1 putative stress-responsive transcriptional regulator [Streptococcus pneumoniae]VSK45826.1 putative stress-responsive transcriptional regulator [Streptococcus pneumoniae]VSK58182.1 putative stress-responsive transcriptional regulator [Streptococcus pneumoniae]VTB53628.1 putative stress-responsive transcriptional regulator [Streptococcus pneumoniae]
MRSGRDKKIAGVCAGVAHYLDMDPTIVQVIWGVLTCCYGAGIVAYIRLVRNLVHFIIDDGTN